MPLTDFCCAQPSLSSVDWTCLDRVCCDVPSEKDEVNETWKKTKTQFKVFGIVTIKFFFWCFFPQLSSFEVHICTNALERKKKEKTHIRIPSRKNCCSSLCLNKCKKKKKFVRPRACGHARGTTRILRCWIVNAARCIATYTFRCFSNYILNSDELSHLADKCVVLFAAGGPAASASRGDTPPTANQNAGCTPLPYAASAFCKPHTACCLWKWTNIFLIRLIQGSTWSDSQESNHAGCLATLVQFPA